MYTRALQMKWMILPTHTTTIYHSIFILIQLLLRSRLADFFFFEAMQSIKIIMMMIVVFLIVLFVVKSMLSMRMIIIVLIVVLGGIRLMVIHAHGQDLESM